MGGSIRGSGIRLVKRFRLVRDDDQESSFKIYEKQAERRDG